MALQDMVYALLRQARKTVAVPHGEKGVELTNRLGLLGSMVALSVLFAASAGAVPVVSFINVTGNNAADAATAGQYTVEVSSDGSTGEVGTATEVFFKFLNAGPAASSITGVYFDDGTLLGIAGITDSGAGVAFSQGASPGNLPGGNSLSPKFATTAGFLADSDPPVQPKGVNPGEWVMIEFDLINAKTYSDTLAALADGSLRIGIHVQGFDGDGSESFVNQPPNGRVPEPGSLFLLGLAVAGLALARRRGTPA